MMCKARIHDFKAQVVDLIVLKEFIYALTPHQVVQLKFITDSEENNQEISSKEKISLIEKPASPKVNSEKY